MTIKEAQWIRLKEISNIAHKILENPIIDKKSVKNLDIEVSAMLRSFSKEKRFFKRL